MDGGDLDDDRLFVFRGFLQGEDELPQVLDGIDVMVGSGGDGVGALGDHAGTGNVADDLGPRQMAADTGLGTLPHLDLDGCTSVQIVRMDAEAAGSDLNDGVFAVAVEVLMQAALTGVIQNAQLCCGACQGLMGVVADGAVAHGRKHDRHGQLELRRQRTVQTAVGTPPDLPGLFAEKNTGLHWLTQRVDGGVGHL